MQVHFHNVPVKIQSTACGDHFILVPQEPPERHSSVQILKKSRSRGAFGREGYARPPAPSPRVTI